MWSHQRVTSLLEMLEGVSVLRLLAAANVTTYQAHPQSRPSIAQFDTLIADVSLGYDILDERKMAALFLGELPRPRLAQERVDQLLEHRTESRAAKKSATGGPHASTRFRGRPGFIDDGHPGTFGNAEQTQRLDYLLLSPDLVDKVRRREWFAKMSGEP